MPLHPLQHLARESQKDLNIPTKRGEEDIHLLLLILPQYHIIKYEIMADTREVDSPQAVQNLQAIQPEEIPNVQTMTPEHTLPRSSRDSGSNTKMET